VRKRVASVGVLAAALAWLLAGWAGVKGPNYDGWSHALGAFGFVAAASAAAALVAMPRVSGGRIAVAAGGALVAVICGVVSIHWFGDGHPRTRTASVLAWIGFLGLSAGAGALSAPRRRNRRVA